MGTGANKEDTNETKRGRKRALVKPRDVPRGDMEGLQKKTDPRIMQPRLRGNCWA